MFKREAGIEENWRLSRKMSNEAVWCKQKLRRGRRAWNVEREKET